VQQIAIPVVIAPTHSEVFRITAPTLSPGEQVSASPTDESASAELDVRQYRLSVLPIAFAFAGPTMAFAVVLNQSRRRLTKSWEAIA
jgi:hypothetical protein